MMKQTDINTFRRKYFDLQRKREKNQIVHDTNTTKPHRVLLTDICEWLCENKYTFYTRVYTKLGEIVDIVAPELPRPFIEVRHSELDKDKKYCKEYDSLRIFVDTKDPWGLL